VRILHIAKSLILNSGVTVFTGEVARAQAEAGHDVRVWCWWYPDYATGKAKCEVHKTFPDEWDADIVHIEAFWDVFYLRAMFKCLALGIPYVVSPHGGLMPRVFTKGRLKKFVVWHMFLRPLLKRASAIHCTSEAEKVACQNLGLSGPFVVAPLGVHLPELYGNDGRGGRPGHPQRNVLFLGRLGEEKGLMNLLDAWHQLQQEGMKARLILAGPDWRDYKKMLDAKIAAEHIEGVEFPGLVQGEAKDKLYRESDIFVLPSPMENFSMVVLDALAYGVPAIATKGTPWSELESERCGWWIDQGVEPLTNALREALSTSDSDLHLLGQNGRALAERKYQWPTIAQQLVNCYQEVLLAV